MNTNLVKIEDMAGGRIEHADIITNFVGIVYSQLKYSCCKVYGDSVVHRWVDDGGSTKKVIPYASINCHVNKRKATSYIDAPQFVMEVIFSSTEKYDRNEKKELYCQNEVSEYWIVDWVKRKVEIYLLDKEGVYSYHLVNTVTDANSEELKIYRFPNIKISFEELMEVN